MPALALCHFHSTVQSLTCLQLPVSTTHSIVGAIIGMSVTAKGFNSVVWYSHTNTFPYCGGVTSIVLSWVFSPILSALAAMILFLSIRTCVLRRQNSYFLSLWLLPLFTALTFWIATFFIVQKVRAAHNVSGLSVWPGRPVLQQLRHTALSSAPRRA